MRLYVKLMLAAALFAGLVCPTGRRMTENLAYEIRVALVCALGSEADFEHLIADTRRTLRARREPLRVDAVTRHLAPSSTDSTGGDDRNRASAEDLPAANDGCVLNRPMCHGVATTILNDDDNRP